MNVSAYYSYVFSLVQDLMQQGRIAVFRLPAAVTPWESAVLQLASQGMP
jgi:hypothetical protein